MNFPPDHGPFSGHRKPFPVSITHHQPSRWEVPCLCPKLHLSILIEMHRPEVSGEFYFFFSNISSRTGLAEFPSDLGSHKYF